MRLVDAHFRLLNLGQPVFLTTDAAACLGLTNSHASKVLKRLSEANHIVRLSRGLWGIPAKLDSLRLPEYLTTPYPSYVSLQSALYFHGMISQIPAMTYAVSLARTQRIKTPVGSVSIHHVSPGFFFGFETNSTGVKMATPEKAIMDVLYLTPARSHLFRKLPELEFPKNFSERSARSIIRKIEGSSRRTLVENQLNELMTLKSRRGMGRFS
jgi:predicted transcriptional regulator of viral defense system